LKATLIKSGLFRYDDFGKLVGQLSSGQRRKLQLARLIAGRANLLVLDEPTNDVSFDVLEALENALRDFPGPVIAASHDRRFMEQFNGELWELRDGDLIQHLGGYAEYSGLDTVSVTT
jgi:macrolide transport system ATP-binding/permease protein